MVRCSFPRCYDESLLGGERWRAVICCQLPGSSVGISFLPPTDLAGFPWTSCKAWPSSLELCGGVFLSLTTLASFGISFLPPTDSAGFPWTGCKAWLLSLEVCGSSFLLPTISAKCGGSFSLPTDSAGNPWTGCKAWPLSLDISGGSFLSPTASAKCGISFLPLTDLTWVAVSRSGCTLWPLSLGQMAVFILGPYLDCASLSLLYRLVVDVDVPCPP
mmetsp:Transcript_29878/g.62414  ORF Transcript_29878/g.62414 Transcript_29878/m.62414 type:complete len:217 (-) Transcript_29878:3007-3657(-)